MTARELTIYAAIGIPAFFILIITVIYFAMLKDSPSMEMFLSGGVVYFVFATLIFVFGIMIFAPASICAFAAEAKGYDPFLWFIIGFLCSWAGCLGIIAMPSKYHRI
jgi:4-amino-4-deoxy-L-arabinose transferase-like glycosyltransferase